MSDVCQGCFEEYGDCKCYPRKKKRYIMVEDDGQYQHGETYGDR